MGTCQQQRQGMRCNRPLTEQHRAWQPHLPAICRLLSAFFFFFDLSFLLLFFFFFFLFFFYYYYYYFFFFFFLFFFLLSASLDLQLVPVAAAAAPARPRGCLFTECFIDRIFGSSRLCELFSLSLSLSLSLSKTLPASSSSFIVAFHLSLLLVLSLSPAVFVLLRHLLRAARSVSCGCRRHTRPAGPPGAAAMADCGVCGRAVSHDSHIAFHVLLNNDWFFLLSLLLSAPRF